MKEAYGKPFCSVYKNRLASSLLETKRADGVDVVAGHLILYLKGNGVMDVGLSRYYDSHENYNVYAITIGWRYDF